MKRLAGVVDADGSLMGREVVRVSVTSSFLDEAVSVRQVGYRTTAVCMPITGGREGVQRKRETKTEREIFWKDLLIDK